MRGGSAGRDSGLPSTKHPPLHQPERDQVGKRKPTGRWMAWLMRVANHSSAGKAQGVFRDCILVRPGTTVRQFAHLVHPDIERHYGHAETVGGLQLGEADLITPEKNIISFKTTQTSAASSQSHP